MTTAVWIAIILAVVVVCGAIGIPYWLTHRRMTDHYEHSRSEEYLAATGRTVEDVDSGRAGRPWRRGASRRQRQAAASPPSAVADRSAGPGTL